MARNDSDSDKNALVVQAPRLPMPPQARSHVANEGQWKALVDAVFSSAKTVDGVMLALEYCRARRLDPFKRVVHVVPMWNSKLNREVETVWPGIGELRTTAHRTGLMAGNDDCVFGPDRTQAFKDSRQVGAQGNRRTDTETCPEMKFPDWAQVTVYRIVGGVRCAFVGPKVRFTETFSGVKGLRVPNQRWQMAPYQMLEKCAEAAALRRAFPEELGDLASAEEMEGKDMMGHNNGPAMEDVPYSVVPEESKSEDKKRPTRAEVKAQREREFIDHVAGLIEHTETLDGLLQGEQAEAETIGALSPAGQKEIGALFDQAKRKFGWTPTKDDPAADDDDAGEREASVLKYVEFWTRECAERAGNIPDLNSLMSTERDPQKQLPPEAKAECDRIFEEAKKSKGGKAAPPEVNVSEPPKDDT